LANLTTYTKDLLYNAMIGGKGLAPPTQLYIALSTTPTDDAGSITEPGGTYARQPILMGPPSAGQGVNVGVSDFGTNTTGDTITITHAAIFDALVGGNMVKHAAVISPLAVLDTQTYSVPAGNLTLLFI